jgi:hypothetical protein
MLGAIPPLPQYAFSACAQFKKSQGHLYLLPFRFIVIDDDSVAGEWRRLIDEELHNLYTSSNITGMIKSRRTRWAGHVALMGQMRIAYIFFSENLEGREPRGRPRRR